MIYLDANVVIRLVEGHSTVRAPIEARIAPFLRIPKSLISSRLTRLECRTKPLKMGDKNTLQQFDLFFSSIEMRTVEITAAVIEKAKELRAKYNLKTPDALHYASAILSGSTVFMTADKGFMRCREVPVEIV